MSEQPPADPGAAADTTQPAGTPDMGDPTTPDMGEPMSDPATTTNPPAPTAPAPPPPPAPAPPAPAPAAPAPPAPAPPAPAPASPTQQPGSGNDANTSGDDGDRGFPANTPVSQMPLEQQRNYYKYQARKHENTVKGLGDVKALQDKASQYDSLVAASKTEQERAVEQAKNEGRTAALKEVGGRLVEAELRVAVGGRLDKDGFAALVGGLDRAQFINGEGNVDTDKVATFVNTLFPAGQAASAPSAGQGQTGQPAAPATPPRGPDFGQGVRTTAPPSPLEAGRAAARARHPQAQAPTPAGVTA
jgi:hypothetical protein